MMERGFVKGWMSGHGRSAHLQFMMELVNAPEGTKFEVGLTWDPENKWRVYQRFGDKALMMPSEEARKLYRIYEKQASLPEWRGIADDLRDTYRMLNSLASEAFHKNQNGEVPPDGVQFMPSQGHG